MTDVNLIGLQALSKCIGFDLESHALIAVEKFGKEQELQLTIDCGDEAIALGMKDRFIKDSDLCANFFEAIKQHWGVETLFLKARGKAVWLSTMQGNERCRNFKKHFRVHQSKIQPKEHPLMTDVNFAGLAALSEFIGVDLNSLAFVAVEEMGSDRRSGLTIDCFYKAIALNLKDRMLEDCRFSVKLLETIKEYWGVEELLLKALGKACYLTSLEAEKRANALIGASKKTQSIICKFSKRVCFDFGDSQIIPMSMIDGHTCLVINCLREDVAISLRERLAEDFRYRKLFAQAVHDFWGLSSICIKSKGEPYHYVSLEGAKCAEDLVAPLYRMLDPKELPLESEPLQAWLSLLQDLLKQEGELEQTQVNLSRANYVEVKCPNKYLAIKVIRLYKHLEGSGYGLRLIVGKEVVEDFPPVKR